MSEPTNNWITVSEKKENEENGKHDSIFNQFEVDTEMFGFIVLVAVFDSNFLAFVP